MPLKTFLFILILDLTTAFNLTKCPAYWELQTEKVKNSFDIEKFTGVYYELAYQDLTQYPACYDKMGGPKCVQSKKSFYQDDDDPYQTPFGLIYDDWRLQCGPIVTPVELLFNLTDMNISPGYFLGWTKAKIGSDQVWPDTVVDYKLSKDGTTYEWVIELQCQDQDDVENLDVQDEIKFTAVNFYAKHYNVTEKYYEDMVEKGYEAGIEVFMNYGKGLRRMPMDDCRWFEDKQELFDYYDEHESQGSTTLWPESSSASPIIFSFYFILAITLIYSFFFYFRSIPPAPDLHAKNLAHQERIKFFESSKIQKFVNSSIFAPKF